MAINVGTVYSQVQRAIADGILLPGSCEVCGGARVVAHHDDYARALDVRWFCHRHHLELHRQPAAVVRI